MPKAREPNVAACGRDLRRKEHFTSLYSWILSTNNSVKAHCAHPCGTGGHSFLMITFVKATAPQPRRLRKLQEMFYKSLMVDETGEQNAAYSSGRMNV